MPSDWLQITVEGIADDLPNALATGPFGSSISSRFFQEAGVPVIRGSNLSTEISTRLIEDKLAFLSAEKAAEFQRSKAVNGDLVFTCWGTIGQVGLIDGRARYEEYIVSNKQMKLTPHPQKADSLFLYYLFSGPEMSGRIVSQAIGSSVPGFNLGQLRSMTLELPPLPEQRTIAHILGTLDDKIELNRQMNETLEDIARAIFRSWFVNFDPVHAQAEGRDPVGMDAETAALFPDRFVESELGSIPAGWEVVSAADEYNVTLGQSPPGTSYNEDGEGVPFYQGSADFAFRYPARRVYCTKPERFARPGDTLVSVRAPVGDMNMAIEECCIGRGLWAVRHKSGSRSYTYYAMQQLKRRFDRFNAEGTVFGSLSKRKFRGIPVVAASAEVVTKFESVASPFDDLIKSNLIESRTLAELRDTLLPKLISGELRLPEEMVTLASTG